MKIDITCPKCGVFNSIDSDICWKCKRPITEKERQQATQEAKIEATKKDKKIQLEKELALKLLDDAIKTGNWDNIPDSLIEKTSSRIILTTSYFVAGKEIEEELDILTSESVYGINIFRDLFASVRDIVGGRSDALQKVLKDLRKTVLSELRREALVIGADAVIAIHLSYQEISGGGKSGMLMLVASGTAVKLNKQQ